MADETRKVELAIDSKKAEASLDRLRKAQEKVALAVREGKVAADVGAKSLSRLEKKERDLIKVNRVLDASFGKTTDEIEKQKQAADDLTRTLARLDEANSRNRQEIGIAGDVGSAGRTIGGAIGAIGGDAGRGIESAIAALSELPDSLEAIGQLKPALAGLPAVTTKVTNAIGLGGLAGSMQTLIPGLGAGTASALALGAATFAIAAPIVAVIAVFKQYSKAAEAQRKILSDTIDVYRSVNQAVAQGLTTEEAEERIAELQALRDGEAQTLSGLEDAYQSMEDQLGGLSGIVKVFSAQEQQLFNSLTESRSAVQNYDREIASLTTRINDGRLAANDLAASTEALAESMTESAEELEREIASVSSSVSQAAQQSEVANERIDNALAARSQTQSDAAELAALEAEFAAQDQQKQAAEHQDALAEIAKDGQERIEDLQAGFVELANDRAEALADADKKGGQKLSDLRNDFFSSQIEKTQDFQRETVKIETDTAKRRIRLLQDITDNLNDASRNNDVLAFLEAQRDGNRKLKEDAEDAQEAEKRRIEEFAIQREREQEAFQEKQAETLAAIAAEKQAIIESYNERRQALQEQIEAEKVAIQERLAAERERYAEQEALEAEQAERQRRRDELRAEQEQRDFDARMAQLAEEAAAAEAKHQAEIAALNALQVQLASLQVAISNLSVAAAAPQQSNTNTSFGGSAANAVQNAIQQGDVRTRNRATRAGSRQGGDVPPGGVFHDGGVIDFPGARQEGFAFVKQGEIIINPANMAQKGSPANFARESVSGSQSQAPTIVFSPTIAPTVGDIASTSEVTVVLREFATELFTGLVQVVEQARVG